MTYEENYNDYLSKVKVRLENEFTGLDENDYFTMDEPDVFIKRIMKRTGRSENEIRKILQRLDYRNKSSFSKKPDH